MDFIASVASAAARELTLFAAIGMLLGGLDDLAVDLLWLGRAWHRQRIRHRRPLHPTMAELAPAQSAGRLAIFVPAWCESEVIGAMLRATLGRLRYGDYRIYVGTYANDPATVAAVRAVNDPRVRLVESSVAGPTNKAECLNRCWRAMRADEAVAGIAIKAVILHDAEDVVHPLELQLYDRMIERFDLVQIPVFPLPAHGRGRIARMVAAAYADEFADAHGKGLMVRQAIGASIPSAGVGCAIRPEMLARVAAGNSGPFDEGSLTEDYELGLRIAAAGGRGAFVTIPAEPGALPVAVRAHFPESFATAIRQKARWVTGIALAGWDRLGWQGGIAERWMRFRDRRSVIAAIVLAAGYASLLIGLVCWPFGIGLPLTPAMRWALGLNGALLLWRLVMRAGMTARIYGRWAGIWSIPRIFVANMIAICSAAKAIAAYVPGRTSAWDKTAHVFPESVPCD
jgi:adsorption protein B